MHAPPSFAFQTGYEHADEEDDSPKSLATHKRKRLSKACNACHRSKRRCDGTDISSYFASRPCHYTDAHGRSVAAPHTGKPDASKVSRSITARGKTYSEDDRPRSSTSKGPPDASEKQSRKRVKHEERETSFNSAPTREDSATNRVPPLLFDADLMRELTNLFFAHRHPWCAIIHKSTFSASLPHNRVPPYLLYAICALAAPLSRRPRIRTTPLHLSGIPFASQAVSLMFDRSRDSGDLLCERNLTTAQALCLLMVHDRIAQTKAKLANSRYRDLALQIVQELGVHHSEHSAISPGPTVDVIHVSIERESVRRIFWAIHLLDLHMSMYTLRPVSLSGNELRIRLPVDETSFELAVHATTPEYLHVLPVRKHRVSELGHLIQIMSLYAEVEQILNRSSILPEWASSLPDHLQFSDQNLQVQKSMFETSSNTGAWCFCCMHVYYASFALALHTIMYCDRNDAQIEEWSSGYEELWGTRIPDLAVAIAALRREPGSRYYSAANARISPPATTSQTHPLGQSLDQLRLHDYGTTWSRTVPAYLQHGMVHDSEAGTDNRGSDAAGPASDVNEPARTAGRRGESLPSLRSSGLLDSWNPPSFSSQSRISVQEPSLETSPPPRLKMESAASRPAGLKWLVNESR
ncbi:fungal-specific transcription factor domain-containing protein [Mycena belliarum]|uniref:Fungal-specific transcription factor domain-containing protein n=1 Tax=Mycena belliarum TaxID=1033014 RepID=A0AAD6TWH6_9AGAR|nr:fungal-specific transcription factor domain-containing protein [Mycena belliae]